MLSPISSERAISLDQLAIYSIPLVERSTTPQFADKESQSITSLEKLETVYHLILHELLSLVVPTLTLVLSQLCL